MIFRKIYQMYDNYMNKFGVQWTLLPIKPDHIAKGSPTEMLSRAIYDSVKDQIAAGDFFYSRGVEKYSHRITDNIEIQLHRNVTLTTWRGEQDHIFIKSIVMVNCKKIEIPYAYRTDISNMLTTEYHKHLKNYYIKKQEKDNKINDKKALNIIKKLI